MPAPPTEKSCDAGFTLVELLVVLAVMGLLAGVAIWRWPSGSDGAKADAVQFASRLAAARDQAIIEARPVAVVVDRSGYRFERRRAGAWLPTTEPGLRSRRWRSATLPALEGTEQRLGFDTVGLPDRPARFQLRSGQGSAEVRVLADGKVEHS